MNDKKYWIWLSGVLGAGARVDEILSVFPNPETLFEADRKTRILSGVFTKNQLDKLETVSLKNAEAAIGACMKNSWGIVTPDDDSYPSQLRRLPDMPLVLFVDGDIGVLENKLIIGVVGTRKPCRESCMIARTISADMARAGAVIVSGGALGIDTCAHEGAMSANGKTVGILGCGFGTRYLVSNEALRREISKNGALITEYPPFAPASSWNFPKRNRIISGLSEGLLVVEAGEASGSLITARLANEQGRDVFAVPGSVLDTAYVGANRLLKDGAKIATCAADILNLYSEVYADRIDLGKLENTVPERKPEPVENKKSTASLSGDAKKIYPLFGSAPIHPDEICAKSGLPMAKLIPALMELEMDGFIKQNEGKNYILI